MEEKLLEPMTTLETISWLLTVGLRLERVEAGWQFAAGLPDDLSEPVRELSVRG